MLREIMLLALTHKNPRFTLALRLVVIWLAVLSSLFTACYAKASKPAISSDSSTKTLTIRPYKAVYEAEYQESIIPITVTGIRRFEPTKTGKWTLSFSADTLLADLTEKSPLSIKGDQLVPDSYYYRTTGIASEYFEHQFDWKSGKVFDVKKDRFWKIKLIPGTQNNITYQEQMRQDVKAGKRAFSYPVAYRGKLKTYEFKVIGEETIESALGAVDCIKIEQLLNKHNKLTTFIWLSKQKDFILIKISQKRGSKPAQEIRIQSLEFLDSPQKKQPNQ